MHLLEDISLKPYNTFGLDTKARFFATINSLEELKEAIALKEPTKKIILGGGSNILLTQDINGLVLHVNIKGISIIKEEEDWVWVKANAGENWHNFVMWCIANDFGGIENLSLIPGNVGTAPIQNIGAYGVELKDVFEHCDALELATGEMVQFSNKSCDFGYRNSIFKNSHKGKYIITSVSFKLSKKKHNIRTNYGTIRAELQRLNIVSPTIKDVSNAVIAIRTSKLPDPKNIGNSGSFFKNPVVTAQEFELLKNNFPEIPSYKISETEIKIPAGWLIEKAGFKGKTFENYGVHKKQALVLVNYGNAKGEAILKLSKLIQDTIQRIFEIHLEAEVNII
ncbi:MAG: UDP-N-acetylmuramate dehydrogenase [Flavobacteriaceae bacterium]|nr:UDP-N-acetylmuramate dehydrogenase [Flavobacteriaceae bacterium]